jgi:ribosome-associated translation inhibitor RaiA
MQIAMHNCSADLVAALTVYVERRVRFALVRFGGRVGQVEVRICADSPAENRCRISVEILPFGRIDVEECNTDLFVAIDHATGRLGRLFGRELERIRDSRVGRESVRLVA